MDVEFVTGKAYRIPWTEHERGWGQRPDGASLHISVEEAQLYITEMTKNRDPKNVPDEYSSPDLNPWEDEIPLVEVTGAVYARLIELGTVWE